MPSRRASSPLATLALLAALTLVGAAPMAMRAAGAPPAGDPDVANERDTIERFAKDPFEQQAREAALRALGRMGGREAAEAAATLMDDPFVHLHDRAVSAWIEMARGPRSAETIAWLGGVALLDRRSSSTRRGAAIALGIAGGVEATKALVASAAHEAEPSVLVAIAAAVERIGSTASEALDPLLGSSNGEVVGAAARALGRVGKPGDARVAFVLPPLLKSRSPSARAGAIDGLAAAAPLLLVYHDAMTSLRTDANVASRIALADALPAIAQARLVPTALESLASLLDDPSWRVRAAAFEASIGMWSREAIPLLLARLRKETGRLRGDALRALRALSGEDPGDDADLWQAWWTTKGAGIDLGPRPAPDSYGHVRRPRPPAPRPGDDTKTAAFFHLPITSERLAFLFDFSGSMKDPVAGAGAGSKAASARAEFERTVAGLSKAQFYDLFIYRYPSGYPPAPKLTRALGRLSPGGDTYAKKTLDWLAKEEPKGWGAFFDALVEVADEDVDTIILLSDGIPSRGTYDRDFRLIAEFVKVNRFRRVAIDTVLVGKDGADRKFMQDLADATGGRFEDATERGPGRPAAK